jgi:hypothetical protein
MKPETAFRQNRVIPMLKKIPNLYWDGIQQVAKVGSLDLHICLVGFFIGMEIKAYTPRLTQKKTATEALQDYNLECIVKAGGIGIKVYPENLEEVRDYLHNLSRGNYDPNSFTKTYRILTFRRPFRSLRAPPWTAIRPTR